MHNKSVEYISRCFIAFRHVCNTSSIVFIHPFLCIFAFTSKRACCLIKKRAARLQQLSSGHTHPSNLPQPAVGWSVSLQGYDKGLDFGQKNSSKHMSNYLVLGDCSDIASPNWIHGWPFSYWMDLFMISVLLPVPPDCWKGCSAYCKAHQTILCWEGWKWPSPQR